MQIRSGTTVQSISRRVLSKRTGRGQQKDFLPYRISVTGFDRPGIVLRISEILARRGVNVALGTDGAASNNRIDLWAEMQTAALLAKHVAADPTAVPASTALEMATINGARALYLGDEIGSLVAGKAADMICVDLGGIEQQPVLDPLSQLVYSASRRDVTDVWIAAEHLVANRELVRLDIPSIAAAAQDWSRRLVAPPVVAGKRKVWRT